MSFDGVTGTPARGRCGADDPGFGGTRTTVGGSLKEVLVDFDTGVVDIFPAAAVAAAVRAAWDAAAPVARLAPTPMPVLEGNEISENQKGIVCIEKKPPPESNLFVVVLLLNAVAWV